ncbi:hypothetical protein GAY28_33420, partial [Azospirillum brasilense]|nr:hypothetical protein [Azospirillum brasilense]
MRTLLALLGILAAAPGWAAGLHHDLTVTLDPAVRRLEVEDRLRLPAGTHRLLLAPGVTGGETRPAGAARPSALSAPGPRRRICSSSRSLIRVQRPLTVRPSR